MTVNPPKFGGLTLVTRFQTAVTIASMADDAILNDRYRLLERIGSGGMATVFKAQDITLRRLVAVKLLHPGLTGDERFLRRFQREAHAAANLSHPNIVTIHDFGSAESESQGTRHYIVMEYARPHLEAAHSNTWPRRASRCR